MKKIFITTFTLYFVFIGNFAFAQNKADNIKVEESSSKNPSIKIELLNMDKLGDDFKDIEKDFNGREIEISDEDSTLVGGLVVLGLGALLSILAFFILCFIFWVMMLVHVIKNPIKQKPLWILIILFFGILGAAVYYFAVKRPMKKDIEIAIEKTKTEEN